jgi:hypothetical protein
MVTNYPYRIRSAEASINVQPRGSGVIGRLLDRLHQMFCSLRGHDNYLQFEQSRLSLRCASCGHESPGWALTAAPPTVRIRGDARRHALIRPQLVGMRRIA